MIDYFNKMTYEIQRIWLSHGGYRFSGRGVLNWDPDSGFWLEAFVEVPKRTESMTLDGGKFGFTPRTDRRLIRMSLGPNCKAIAPYIRVNVPRLYHGRISIGFSRIIFIHTFIEDHKFLDCSGEAIFRDVSPSSWGLPEAVDSTREIDGRYIGGGSVLGGLLVEGANIRILGTKDNDTAPLEFRYGFPVENASQSYAWDWPLGASYALSFMRGATTPLLKREAYVRGKRREEIRIAEKAESLGVLSPLIEKHNWDKYVFARLADFFTRGGPVAQICRNILDQMSEAVRQRSWQAKELLLSTILEAALRNVFNQPFVPGRRTQDFNASHLLSEFVKKYLDPVKWREARKKAEKTS